MNLKCTVSYLLIILAIIIATDLSEAGKHDKKKPPPQNNASQQHHHKNQTISHGHKNHTAPHTNHSSAPDQNSMFINNEQQHHNPQNPQNIGWSLNNNQAQQHHNNPNGFVMQSHDTSHGMAQPGAHQQSAQPQQQQSSGVGGIALGIYLISD